MRTLWLLPDQARQIAAQARADAPRETCGILAGHAGQVLRVIPITNVAAQPEHHFELSQVELSRQLPALVHDGLELIGFYHSHPRTEPIPSPTDVAQAYYPDAVMLIISLREAEPRLAAWSVRWGQVEPVTLHLDNLPPDAPDESELPLTPAQRNAALLGAVVALLILLTVSLTLLPPAPPIPN